MDVLRFMTTLTLGCHCERSEAIPLHLRRRCVGWAKAAPTFVDGTLPDPPCPRGGELPSPRGHGGTQGVPGCRSLGRLCPPYETRIVTRHPPARSRRCACSTPTGRAARSG